MGHHFANGISGAFILYENFSLLIQIWLQWVPIHDKSALFHVMARRQTGDRPLAEAMVIKFTDACMRHTNVLISYTEMLWRVNLTELTFFT